jgi:hypothetical protein
MSPGNIMLTDSGAKLLDFGLAKYQRSGAAGDITMTNPVTDDSQVVGTLL